MWCYFTFTPTTPLTQLEKRIIYSQALQYDMIISVDHIIQEKRNNLATILLTCAYLPHLIIKKIKKPLIYIYNNLLSQQTAHTETNIFLIITLFSNKGKSFIAIIHTNWHTIVDGATLSIICLSKHLFLKSKSSSIPNYLLHSRKHMTNYNTILNATAHIRLQTPKHKDKYTHSS